MHTSLTIACNHRKNRQSKTTLPPVDQVYADTALQKTIRLRRHCPYENFHLPHELTERGHFQDKLAPITAPYFLGVGIVHDGQRVTKLSERNNRNAL